MKISFITPYLPAISYASSRIRSLYPCNAMCEIGIESIFGFSRGANWYVINKQAASELIVNLMQEKKSGAKIVYDICDFPIHKNLEDICDVITCPTEIMQKKIKSLTNKPVYVWEDCLDYDIQSPSTIEIRPNTVGWFGNWNNAHLPISTLNTYLSRKFIISDIEKIENYYNVFLDDTFRLVDWNFENFRDTIKLIGLTILDVPDNELYKSDNKALVSLACGIPILVSKNSSAYHFLEKCDKGLGEMYLINNGKELTDNEAQTQINISQPYIFENRTAKVAAKKLIEILYLCANK